jgi:prepilin-type N-terminal cleavage/methylation domain-containing protein
MPDLTRLRARALDERGYTLIELLLATVAGLVVSAAALLIVVMSYSFASSQPERVDANQEGAIAMQTLVQTLSSSCVEGLGVSPVVGVTGGTGRQHHGPGQHR